MADLNVSEYAHSPVHKAIILKDHENLKEIISELPKLGNPFEIKTEAESIAEDEKAATISSVLNRRDVPNGDTPLHLAVKLVDIIAIEMLMIAGANQRLKNKEGWSAFRQAIINKQEKIALIIVKYSDNDYEKIWHRRLPRYLATMRRMRDFYMEITFHFESSVIPFISRIAPSDTYKIWKKGANMRADMTLAGFDGLKIKRSDQSVLFLGDENDDERKIGFMCLVSHKKKEVIVPYLSPEPPKPSENEMKQYLAKKCNEEKVVRVGIDVSQALLVPQLTWRRKEKKEMVGLWKSKVYDMQNVVLIVKSRRVPGVQAKAKLASKESSDKKDDEIKFDDILTEEERKQLEAELNFSSAENNNNGHKKGKKGKLGGHREKDHNHKGKNIKANSMNTGSSSSSSNSSSSCQKNENGDSEYKKGVMPVLWLSNNFPLKIEEFLPLLDILAEKVKAVRRVRELLTTRLPKGTFPVKIAIPVISTVRVLVTFTKFEELPQVDEFESAPSSPTSLDLENAEAEPEQSSSSSSSWFQWIKTSSQLNPSAAESSSRTQDLFSIPSDYTWTTVESKIKSKTKAKAQKS